MTRLVIGMGASGFSMARHWHEAGFAVEAVDDRPLPPQRRAFAERLPLVPCRCGENFHRWRRENYDAYDEIAVSPGVRPPAAEKLTIDAAMFAAAWARANPPTSLLAVTGSNGKSTVVSLIAHLCRLADLSADAVGNIGEPLLDALARWHDDGFPAVAAVELSSFQLALTPAFPAAAAVILNIGDDHLDRHGEQAQYAAAKQNIYHAARRVVANKDDAAAFATAAGRAQTTFSTAAAADWYMEEGDVCGTLGGDDVRFATAAMSPTCQAQPANVLAALALLQELPLSPRAVANGLASFNDLPHRRQTIANVEGVRYIDDSKATNVAATLFALNSLASDDIVLIAGGDDKGQDFAPLAQAAARQRVRRVVLIGRATEKIRGALTVAHVACEEATDMEDAVSRAAAVASGDGGGTVLLSPACSSLDLFADYRARAAAFALAVNKRGKKAE